MVLGIGRDLHLQHFIWIFYSAIARHITLLDSIHMLHPADDLPPDRVLAVQMRRLIQDNEELGVRAVRILCSRRANCAALKWFARKFQIK